MKLKEDYTEKVERLINKGFNKRMLSLVIKMEKLLKMTGF